MPILNDLGESELKSAERVFGWLLVLFGYIIAMAMGIDTAGWDDPVFNIMRRVPFTPYSWAAALAISASIYACGHVANGANRWRGPVIITGASLCSGWWVAVALAMSRMVYVMPMRITDLWPLVTFFIGVLYSLPIIWYANAFTGQRWSTNPYQLWATMFLMIISLSQIIIGVAPSSVFTEVERPVALQLALVNFGGAAIVMFGLHLRNKEMGLNLELWGAFSLVATLGWYCVTVLKQQTLAGTTVGFGIAESFVFATLHRGIQIMTLKYARWRDNPRLEKRVKSALTFDVPKHGR